MWAGASHAGMPHARLTVSGSPQRRKETIGGSRRRNLRGRRDSRRVVSQETAPFARRQALESTPMEGVSGRRSGHGVTAMVAEAA
jgi:hypothetical protein